MSIINANALHIPLANETVQTVVTSPPYYGLRDYGTARWEGGDPECDHKQATARNDGGRANINGFHGSLATDSDKGAMNYRDTCGKCGAIRVDNQLGLEPTPEAYVANMVAVFREVKRVLRDDGTLWLNLGDSYASGNMTGKQGPNGITGNRAQNTISIPGRKPTNGLKEKDLVGIPWRVAFALQADGWYLRSDIIWAKPNPMPESVTDRPTKAHEYIFLLTKQARYYYDADAVREEATYGGYKDARSYNGKNGGDVEDPKWDGRGATGRNRRTVWTIPTAPYSGAHFATFPPDLVRPCVLAGSKPGDIVLDPFSGSGTVVMVAQEYGRRGVGLELNPKYIELALDRTAQARAQMVMTL